MEIRKISIGPDYKGGAMHYLVGQRVCGDSNEIHLIKRDSSTNSIKIFIKRRKWYFGKSSTIPFPLQLNII